jgi:hypothetical protein
MISHTQQVMQSPAIPVTSTFYTKLGGLCSLLKKYADGLEANKARQDNLQERKAQVETPGTLVASKGICVMEVSATEKELVPAVYSRLVAALGGYASYQILELANYLPEDYRRRWEFLKQMTLPFKAMVS